MSTNLKFFVGIDISKKHLDVALISNGNTSQLPCLKFTNDTRGFAVFSKWLHSHHVPLNTNTLIILEHTGLYQQKVIEFCSRFQISLCAEQANQIRWSLGLQRGKTDRIDACRIALYGYKNRDTIVCTKISSSIIEKLQRLLSQRSRLVNARKQLVTSCREMEGFVDKKEIRFQEKVQAPVVKALDKSIDQIEKELLAIIREDEQILKNYKLLLTITGVGVMTAMNFIVYTHNFSRYKTGKELACYCGVVPFERRSGSSIRGKSQVSHMANKTLKMLLHMAAVTAIQHNAELKAYYERKVSAGKYKMQVINAVRNKLVLRISSVVNRGTPFVENYSNKAA